MGRWEPDARGRLLRAALDLFAEKGYEATSAAEIAARAGLTKTTLFRQFADKREILFQGQESLVRVATEGVASAPVGAAPLELLESGVRALCDTHMVEQQGIGRQINTLIDASADLRERAAFKRASIATALADALAERLRDHRLAGVLADIGVRAYYDGFDTWIDTRRADPLWSVVSDELTALWDAIGAATVADASTRQREVLARELRSQ
jgi:AcrR family transcriptional regulator